MNDLTMRLKERVGLIEIDPDRATSADIQEHKARGRCPSQAAAPPAGPLPVNASPFAELKH
jgi:hypothetical protein